MSKRFKTAFSHHLGDGNTDTNISAEPTTSDEIITSNNKKLDEIYKDFGVRSVRPINEEDEEESDLYEILEKEKQFYQSEKSENTNKDSLSKPLVHPSRFIFPNPIHGSTRLRYGYVPIQSKQKRETRVEEKYKILNIDKSSLDFKKDSVLWHIFKYLSRCKGPTHINKIIESLSKKKILKSKYHKYAKVSHLLNNNFFIFKKTDKATFSIRKGFRKFDKPEIIKDEIEFPTHITTLSDVIKLIATDCRNENISMYPGLMLKLLREDGYDCQYSSVYRIMQSTIFRRVGYSYQLR